MPLLPQTCIYCVYSKCAPDSLASPLHSLSIQVLITLGGAFFRWAALVLDFGGALLGGVGLATVSVFFDLCAACAVLDMTSRLSAMQVHKMVVYPAAGQGLGAIGWVHRGLLVVAHSFSKSFLMTSWCLGRLVMPSSKTRYGKLEGFNTSCASVFTQRCPAWRWPVHAAACMCFFCLWGHGDSLATAKRLVTEAGWIMTLAKRRRAGGAGALPPKTRSAWFRVGSAQKNWLEL